MSPRLSRLIHSRHLAAVLTMLGLAAARPTDAAVTVYTSLTDFLAAAPLAALATDLEDKPTGATLAFSLGGLTFSSPLNNMYIIGPSIPGTTSPLPPSHMLAAGGQEHFNVYLTDFATGASTTSMGFTLLTNAYSPHSVALYNVNNSIFFTHQPTQAPNTVGFLGFVSDTPFIKMRWIAASGEIQNTALDDFYVDVEGAVPTETTSWGNVKLLFH